MIQVKHFRAMLGRDGRMICQRPPPILIKLVKQIHVTAGIGKHAVKNGTAALGARGKEHLQNEKAVLVVSIIQLPYALQPQRLRANAGAVHATPKHVVAVRREAVRVAQDGKDLAGEPRLRVRHRLAQRVQEFRRVPQGLDHLHRSGGVDNGDNKFERAHGGVGVVWHAGGCADMI